MPVERLVRRVGSLTIAVVGGLDVDGGDVVGEQHDLVGVQLVGVLARQVLRPDEAGLQQPDDEGAGAGERVEDCTPSSERLGAECSRVGRRRRRG